MTQESNSVFNTVATGGVAATALAFLRSMLTNMMPYAIVAVPLIILDLLWGIRAARYREERVTFSRAFRRTMSKTFDYICWIVIASGIALAFEKKWLEFFILGLVIFNELTSIVGNYFETKGIQLSFVAVYRFIFKKAAEKHGIEVTDEEAKEIIKPQLRDAKGRFVKKQR